MQCRYTLELLGHDRNSTLIVNGIRDDACDGDDGGISIIFEASEADLSEQSVQKGS